MNRTTISKVIHVDVAVIGGGSAGMVAFNTARKKSARVLLIEKGKFGTTCARVGCMPSKLLIAAAECAHQVRKAPSFGLHINGDIQIDGSEVMSRVKRERDRFVGFVLDSINNIPSECKLKGHAKFLDNSRLIVNEDTIVCANRIVIATGSRPVYPPSWSNLQDRLVVNDDIFEWDSLPASVAVFGVGVIGLELGQALHRLGVKVKLFGKGGKVGIFTDPALKEKAAEIFGEEMCVNADADVQSMKLVEDNNKVEIKYQNKDKRSTGLELETFVTDYVLAATGRRPNTDDLGLETTDVEVDERGVPKANTHTLQTSVENIFIAGDASNQVPLLHEASDQGRIAGNNAGRFPEIRAGLRRSAISIVFTDPQMAMVGETYENLKKSKKDCFAFGEASFENQGRSRVMLVNKGLLRVYGEHGSGRFLGMEMIGPGAEHIAHLLAWAHQQNMTVSEMLNMPFYHPVIEEGLRTALRNLNSQLRLGPPVPHKCLDHGPGA